MTREVRNNGASGDALPKVPAFQWYPGDFRRDTALQACSWPARSLWRDMLDIMHDGSPRGYLTAGQSPLGAVELARMIGGISVSQVKRLLVELETRGVFSRDPRTGAIYSRRMVRDEAIRRSRAAGGVKSLDNPNVPRRKHETTPAEGYPSTPPSDQPSRRPLASPHPPSSGESSLGSPAVAPAIASASADAIVVEEDRKTTATTNDRLTPTEATHSTEHRAARALSSIQRLFLEQHPTMAAVVQQEVDRLSDAIVDRGLTDLLANSAQVTAARIRNYVAGAARQAKEQTARAAAPIDGGEFRAQAERFERWVRMCGVLRCPQEVAKQSVQLAIERGDTTSDEANEFWPVLIDKRLDRFRLEGTFLPDILKHVESLLTQRATEVDHAAA